MPAIYHEGSWLGNATDPEVLVKDTVGWTGKNKLKTGVGASGSIGNGTWKINSDGSITINATLSSLAIAPWRLATGGMNSSEVLGSSDIPKGTYRIVWLNANGQKNDNIRLQIFGTNGALNTGTEIANTHTAETVTIDDTYAYYYARVWLNAGTINDTIYGMLVSTDITDPTYEPYHESVEEEIEQIYADNGVLGAKNLLEVTANTQTLSGVTFTVNRDSDGNVINVNVNGTASANTSYVLRTKTPLAAGKSYIMSRGEVGDADFQMVATAWNSGSYVKNITEVGAGGYTEKSFVADYNGYNDIQISIFVRSGKTISNAIVYPMIRLASDPDDTYQPYAMTNRELTEKVTIQKIATAAANQTFATQMAALYTAYQTLTAEQKFKSWIGFSDYGKDGIYSCQASNVAVFGTFSIGGDTIGFIQLLRLTANKAVRIRIGIDGTVTHTDISETNNGYSMNLYVGH